jgi:hypothetical protein
LCSGFTEEDFDTVADFFDRSVVISEAVKAKAGKKLSDFKALLADGGRLGYVLTAAHNS